MNPAIARLMRNSGRGMQVGACGPMMGMGMNPYMMHPILGAILASYGGGMPGAVIAARNGNGGAGLGMPGGDVVNINAPVGYNQPYGGGCFPDPFCGPLSYGNLLNCGPSFNRDRLGCCPPELLPYLLSPFYAGPKCKDQILSGSIAVAAGDTETLIVTPVVPFCVERVTVPSFIGPFFDINTFLIGNEPQTAGGGPTNASVFSEGAADSVLKGDCVQPAVPITLSITNTSGDDRTFYITFFGKSVD